MSLSSSPSSKVAGATTTGSQSGPDDSYLEGFVHAAHRLIDWGLGIFNGGHRGLSEINDTVLADGNAKGFDTVPFDEEAIFVPVPTNFNEFPVSFKQVVAKQRLVSELNDQEMLAIINAMLTHFNQQALEDLVVDTGLTDEELAVIWMMKLAHNRQLDDETFLKYVQRGHKLFTGNTHNPLSFSSIANNDLPAMAWYLKGLSGKTIFEHGSTRLHVRDQDRAWSLWNRLTHPDSGMTARPSTHFSGTSLTSGGFGKDIPDEALRDHMPFQMGALLLHPTSSDAACDMFATRVVAMGLSLNSSDISALYMKEFSIPIPTDFLNAIMTANPLLQSKMDVYRLAHQWDPGRFKLGLGIKFEDFGFNDTWYHSAVHSLVGIPLAKFYQWAYGIGSSSTTMSREFAALHPTQPSIHLGSRKEHLSTLPRHIQQLALSLVDFLPEFEVGFKKRFNLAAMTFFEPTICLNSADISVTNHRQSFPTALGYLLKTAQHHRGEHPELDRILGEIESQLSHIHSLGLEGSEETLLID